MSLREKLNSTVSIPVIIFFFALFFNQFFGNRGVFPIDSFSHFDTGYRVLNGELPFKDYWVVSGPFVDFLQAFLFLIFGVNWQTYLLNASILNGIFAVLTYKLFLDFKLDKKFSFFLYFLFSYSSLSIKWDTFCRSSLYLFFYYINLFFNFCN